MIKDFKKIVGVRSAIAVQSTAAFPLGRNPGGRFKWSDGRLIARVMLRA
jgi:hypothetical protein